MWAVSRQIPSKEKKKKAAPRSHKALGKVRSRQRRRDAAARCCSSGILNNPPKTLPGAARGTRAGWDPQPQSRGWRLSAVSEVTVTPRCNICFQADLNLFFFLIYFLLNPLLGGGFGSGWDPTAVVGNRLLPAHGPGAPSQRLNGSMRCLHGSGTEYHRLWGILRQK